MKRLFDLFLSVILLILLLAPILVIGFLVKITAKGKVLYWSERVGVLGNFQMPKFCTMKAETPQLATHLLKNPDEYLTVIGKFLRSTSLDELPQIWSVLVGKMSFVGPRPALFNQDDLIKLRIEKGVDKLLPGITGWAQVNGRDELSIADKVALEVEYLQQKSFWFDVKILWLTLLKVLQKDGVSH
ncbi:MAG: sugar transferase [Candidatus Thioglobus sp.]|nr:sugar transferase [Candidatus Thioglobus sp.]